MRLSGRVARDDGARTLCLVASPLEREVRRATSGFRLNLEFEPDLGLFVARVESGCPPLLIVDVDMAGSFQTLGSFARSLRPDLRILAVTCYWSDCDEALRDHADAILHKPPRRRHWEAALDRLQVPRVVSAVAQLPAAS